MSGAILQADGTLTLLQHHAWGRLAVQATQRAKPDTRNGKGKKNQARYIPCKSPGLQPYIRRKASSVASAHKGPPLPLFLTGNLVST